MSSDPTESHVSARILDLNSVAVVHQAEIDDPDAGKSDGNFASRVDLSLADEEDDKNVRDVSEKEGFDPGANFAGFAHERLKQDEEIANPNATGVGSSNDLEIKVDDADESGAKDVSEDANLVSKEFFSDDFGSVEVFMKDDFAGEVDEGFKSDLGEGMVDLDLGEFVDNSQFEIKEEEVSKSAFFVCDMVWGKVRSHPWWPGQIYDPSVASNMALKHQKKDQYLVAYFGDKTFAWNDKSRLKHFESFFSQMEKQSSFDEFVGAVNEALGEVSRRIEIGLACGCIADELVDLKHKIVENAGIKEGTFQPMLDRFMVASSFDPNRLLDEIHGLAQLPCEKFDKLEVVKVKAQLKAICLSKGYSELPEFRSGGGLSHDEEVSSLERREFGQEGVECIKEKRKGRGRPPVKKKTIEEDGRGMEYENDETILNETHLKEKRRGRGRPPGKRKAIDEDYESEEHNKARKKGTGRLVKRKGIEEDGRKQRSLPELMEQTADCVSFDGKDEKDEVKASSNSCRKKEMIRVPCSVGYGKGKKKSLSSLGDLGSLSDYSSGLKIGQRLSRVANEMNISGSEHHDIKLQKGNYNTNGRTSSVHGNSKSPRKDSTLIQDYPASNEMLSQLCFAAISPTKSHRINSIVSNFLVNWRDSHVSDSLDDDKLLSLTKSKRGRKKTADSDLFPVEVKLDYLQDSYWSDVIFEESPKKEIPSRGRKRKADSDMNQRKKKKVEGFSSSLSSTLEPALNSSEHVSQHVSDGSAILTEMQQEEIPANFTDDQNVEEWNPAALILSFSDPDVLPSKENLITFFSQYGPLKHAETRVSIKSKRASVMFKRGADAEVAFSSTGKFDAFGPKLVSYRLRFSTSSSPSTTPEKDPSPTVQETSVVPDSEVLMPTNWNV